MSDDITDTLAPKSDQLDAVELINGPRTFTVERVDVRKGAEQPVSVHFLEFDRPWRPGRNQRRVLSYCWGQHSSQWAGRRVTLVRDPEVVYGGKKVGGIRIQTLSHIDGPMSAPILEGQGRPGTYEVLPMPRVDELRCEWVTADAERRKEIEAEVAAITNGGQR